MTSTENAVQQLRLDKIIYAVEAVAINSCLIVVLIVIAPLKSDLIGMFRSAVMGLAVGYTVYALWGNLIRLRKIKQLEKE